MRESARFCSDRVRAAFRTPILNNKKFTDRVAEAFVFTRRLPVVVDVGAFSARAAEERGVWEALLAPSSAIEDGALHLAMQLNCTQDEADSARRQIQEIAAKVRALQQNPVTIHPTSSPLTPGKQDKAKPEISKSNTSIVGADHEGDRTEAALSFMCRHPQLRSEVQTLLALNTVMFDHMEFGPSTGAAYSSIDNSFLNKVLSTRRGIPISLSVVYIAVARNLGIHLHPVGLPYHFIVKLPSTAPTPSAHPTPSSALSTSSLPEKRVVDKDEKLSSSNSFVQNSDRSPDGLFIDVYDYGRFLSGVDCVNFLHRVGVLLDPEYLLVGITNQEVYTRMLRNIKNIEKKEAMVSPVGGSAQKRYQMWARQAMLVDPSGTDSHASVNELYRLIQDADKIIDSLTDLDATQNAK